MNQGDTGHHALHYQFLLSLQAFSLCLWRLPPFPSSSEVSSVSLSGDWAGSWGQRGNCKNIFSSAAAAAEEDGQESKRIDLQQGQFQGERNIPITPRARVWTECSAGTVVSFVHLFVHHLIAIHLRNALFQIRTFSPSRKEWGHITPSLPGWKLVACCQQCARKSQWFYMPTTGDCIVC